MATTNLYAENINNLPLWKAPIDARPVTSEVTAIVLAPIGKSALKAVRGCIINNKVSCNIFDCNLLSFFVSK